MDNKERAKRLDKIIDKENNKEKILDCTKEIEEYIKKILPEENNN